MRALLLSLALLGPALLGPASAQEAPAAPPPALPPPASLEPAAAGGGFLTSQIEGILSGPGREVRIEGFAGLLSSRATLGRLTIADEDGVWLAIEDAELDWSRSALLQRRLEVETLAARAITLARLPEAGGAGVPRATARELALPELPVAVEIGRVAADRVTLDAGVLGEPAEVALEGSARLVEGAGALALQARRIDGEAGRFDVQATIDPVAGLDLDLALEEGQGGIAARALGIPGEPALALAATAAGPLDDLTARFELQADGAERLSGSFAIEQAEGGRRFALDARGDLAPILAPERRSFFGDDLLVQVQGVQDETGGFDLSRLAVEAAELNLQGSLSLAPGGVPEAFDLRLVVRDGEEGVLLPLGGVRVGSADLVARFDAEEGEAWTLDGTVENLRAQGFAFEALAVEGGGTIGVEAPRRADGRVALRVSGIEAEDEGIAQALGDALALAIEARWEEGAPVALDALRLTAAGLDVEGQGVVEGAAFEGALDARVADLGRFEALAGLDLGGALEARFEGRLAPVTGAFDGRLVGQGQDLSTGIEAADALLGGRAEVVADAARTTQGTEIRAFTIETAALQAAVEGLIAPPADEPVRLSYRASLDDVGRVLDEVSGPARLEGRIEREGPLAAPPPDLDALEAGALAEAGPPPEAGAPPDPDAPEPFLPPPGVWRVTLDAEAPQETRVSLSALVPDEGPADIDFRAEAADLGPYIRELPGPASIEGRAQRSEAGEWTARLTADLPQEIALSLDADLDEAGVGEAVFEARVADLGVFVDALPGEATAQGRAVRDASGAIDARLTAALPQGIAAEIAAAIPQEGPEEVLFDARIDDLGAFVEALPGPVTLSGRAVREEGAIEAAFDLAAPEGISARVEATVPPEGPQMARYEARVADAGAFTEIVSGPAALTGTAMRDDEEVLAEGRLDGPEGIEATYDARLAGGVLTARLDGALADLGAFAGPLAGPATFGADLRREAGETRAQVTLDGEAGGGLAARVDALQDEAGAIEATYEARVADASALGLLPLPEGALEAAGTARRAPEGALEADARLTGPAGLAADAQVALSEAGDVDARIDAVIAEPGALQEGVPGPIEAEATARRQDGAWSAEVALRAPDEARADLVVSLPPEGEALIDFDLSVPEPEAYLNGLPGPLVAQGQARRGAAGWSADLEASAADGSRVVAEALIPDEGRAEVAFDATLADLGRFVPQLPGEASAEGQAVREEGLWRGEARIAAPAGLSGTVAGTLAEDGAAEIDFDLSIGDLGALAPPLPGPARAAGRVTRGDDGAFALAVNATGPQGTRAAIEGTFDPAGPVDIAFDAALANVAAFEPRLGGAVSAQGSVTSQGGPLAVQAAVSGPAGAQTQVSGTLARDLATADLALAGTAPLDLANPFIQPRAIEGLARFDLALSGPLDPSGLTGTVAVADARLALPDQRLAIVGIDATASLSGGQAILQATGGLATGGQLALSGPIALEAPFAADLAATAQGLVIVDPLLYQTTVNGQVSITGPLTGGGGQIAGVLDLAQTDVRIPTSGFGGAGAIPLIEHRNAPLAVRVTRERARLADAPPATRRGTPQRNAFGLDVLVRAENRIFVRGRGLDAELGGTLRLTGTTADVVPAGQFDLIRGRLDLLGERFVFSEGSIALQGEFVPVVRLVATTTRAQDELSIILEGELTDPDLSVVSAAGLPEDEAIARLLFGRDLTQLSPLQAARLANAVAELSGRGGLGIIAGLREGAGLDDLDITVADDGAIAVRAGAYLAENIYTDLAVDAQGRTEINLNLDVTDDIRVRGRVNAEGQSALGVFFERDY